MPTVNSEGATTSQAWICVSDPTRFFLSWRRGRHQLRTLRLRRSPGDMPQAQKSAQLQRTHVIGGPDLDPGYGMLEFVGLFLWLAALELVDVPPSGFGRILYPSMPHPTHRSRCWGPGEGCRIRVWKDDGTSGTTFQVQIRSIYILPRTCVALRAAAGALCRGGRAACASGLELPIAIAPGRHDGRAGRGDGRRKSGRC
jgi:hypothetical protein